MIGIGHIKNLFRDARARTADGHRAMAKAAGMSDCVKGTEDDMGDMIATGDIHYHQQPPPPSAPASAPSTLGKVATVAASTIAAGGLGVAAGLLTMYLNRPASPTPSHPPAIVSPATQYEAIYERQMPDGTWKEFKREALKP